jgi:RHS repeat-associated protein
MFMPGLWCRSVSFCATVVLSCCILCPSSHSADAGSISRIPARPGVADIFRLRVFDEPLVPVGGEPTADENAALAAALQQYSKRGADDFSILTRFVEQHPQSPWNASLLTGLGLEYYNTAHYSQALAAWNQAWGLSKDAKEPKGKAIADHAVGELAYMYARLGRMNELNALLKSVESRTFSGPATEKISGAREGLWNMQNRPEIAFRCGPLALHRIKASTTPNAAADMVIFQSASTQKGFSLAQVADLSKKIGLNYQMAFREKDGELVFPSVVHWKVGHYAAMVRREGDKYLLEDPTFGNTVWATRAALEAETSGYFLIPPGSLPKGWRTVEPREGETIWGKGITSNNDDKNTTPRDPKTSPCSGDGRGMAVSSIHLMLVNLNLVDTPVGYSPPVGPPVGFTVRYSHREAYQPGVFTYSNFGPKWTCDWISYITDNPQSPSANVNHYVRGGGTRAFTGFNTNSQSYGFQQYEQTLLRRVAPANYEMTGRDGSKMVFSQSDGSIGTSRKIFLTQIVDPFGNTVTLNYDSSLRLTNITDAIGQATTLAYGNTNDLYKITQVTDPFGRFATFAYDSSGRLTNITDVIGITSRFTYEGAGDFINALTTPYGMTSFTRGSSGTTRWLETLYPDGSKERVEFNQSSTLGVPFSDPVARVPTGMGTFNEWLYARNTYYWSRTACATAYGDYTKAKIYHWLHNVDLSTTSGILESTKEPLEGRVWYDYVGQSSQLYVGSTDQPRRVGRVLDDGSTQLHTYGYNAFGNVTNTIDPLGRTFSYLYETNGIDLLEVRMTRAGQNQLLYKATYDAQHLRLTTAGADGQTTTNTYNARGQLLTTRNPLGETTTYLYDTNGYLVAVDRPLPGTNDLVTATYDAFGRMQTKTDENGYTVAMTYDALNRVTNITYPDATFDQITYHRLDPSVIRDRAGQEILLEHDSLRNLVKQTDPLGRVTQLQWCDCGSVKSLADALGRTTEWQMDVQGRLVAKQYGDGSKVSYFYETASGRLRQMVDETLQAKQFTYNLDNTVRSISYVNSSNATPAVGFTYDADYVRPISMTDGIGTTLYSYHPINVLPALGAGQLASMAGPYTNETSSFGYDAIGRRISTAINGAVATMTYDAGGRLINESNALGAFTYTYEGASPRLLATAFPNGQATTNSYGDNSNDRRLQQITHRMGTTPISQFTYGRDVAAGQIETWSQQAGAAAPDLYTFGYDAADRLISATVTNSGLLINAFAYTYDAADNRLMEVAGGTTNFATYNALNALSTSSAPGSNRTNEWNAEGHLVAVDTGTERTEFAYDGSRHVKSIRHLTNGVEASFRTFAWCDNQICEERDAANSTTKRFFKQGMRIESGTNAGNYFYTRDHLGSIRELTDGGGNVRARYAYDPFGRRNLVAGDMAADFGYAGMFWPQEVQLYLTLFRAYDPELGRWLSRDPLRNAEIQEGANLYAYVGNNPVNATDPLGLCCEKELKDLNNILRPGLPSPELSPECHFLKTMQYNACTDFAPVGPAGSRQLSGECAYYTVEVRVKCEEPLRDRWIECLRKPCQPTGCKVGPGGGGGFPGGGGGTPPSGGFPSGGGGAPGSGGFPDGLPDVGGQLGKGEADIEDPFDEQPATASAGGPAERQAAQTVRDVKPEAD